MPLCLYEVRMSPQLHRFVYGYHPSAFTMTRRFGGYRPMVFMQHGLMLGMWMATATLTGLWLWWNGALKRLWGMDLQWLVIAMAVTTVLCRSTGSILLLALGFAVLLAARWTRSSVPMLALLALTPLYIAARLGGLGIEDTMVSISREFISVDRGNSLRFRLQNEDRSEPAIGRTRAGPIETETVRRIASSTASTPIRMRRTKRPSAITPGQESPRDKIQRQRPAETDKQHRRDDRSGRTTMRSG